MSENIRHLDFEGLPFRWVRRRVRRARIEFVPPRPLLVIPLTARPEAVLKANRESILRRYKRARNNWEQARLLPLLNRDEDETTYLVNLYLDRYMNLLGVQCRELKWRQMKRRWGTCRSDGVILLNRFLRHLPEPLVAFVVFHETLHLKNMRHDKRFRDFVARIFPNHREMDHQMELYGIRMRFFEE